MIANRGRGLGATSRPQTPSLQDLADPSRDSRHLVGRARPEWGGVAYLGPEGRKLPIPLSVVYLGPEGEQNYLPD